MSRKCNETVREAIKKSRLYQWQIAEKIGISEFTFTRWLRSELSDERKELILKAIAELSAC